MILLVDVGNTRTKYCRFLSGVREQHESILNDELSQTFLATTFNDITQVVFASVGKASLAIDIENWCRKKNITCLRVLSEAQKHKVVSAYHEPEKLGVDRWLTLIGAAATFPNKNILIIDAGTATTIDLLACNGKHQGGFILAGINTLISSVMADTSNVKAKDTEKVSLNFGTTTSDNVHNAAWLATVGSINLAIFQAGEKGFKIEEVIITGGNAEKISSLILCENKIIKDLLFSGLQAYI